MPRKKKPTTALRKAASYKLGDLKTISTIKLDPWAVGDPERSYEANACDVVVHGRELVISFAQTVPGAARVVSAISIGIPIKEAAKLIEGFINIRDRLEAQHFSESDLEGRRLDREQFEKNTTVQNYRRETADLIRGLCGDNIAILDFYRRPIVTEEIIEARPDDPLSLDAVIRVRCPAEVVSLMLQQMDQALQREEADV